MTQELRLIFFKHHLLKRVSFLLLNCLSAFDKNQLTLYMSVLDWKLCYVPPISVFLLRPAPCCLMTVSQEGLRSGHVSLPLLFLSFKYIKTDRQNKFEKKLQVQKRDKKKSNTYIIGDAEKETREQSKAMYRYTFKKTFLKLEKSLKPYIQREAVNLRKLITMTNTKMQSSKITKLKRKGSILWASRKKNKSLTRERK